MYVENYDINIFEINLWIAVCIITFLKWTLAGEKEPLFNVVIFLLFQAAHTIMHLDMINSATIPKQKKMKS